MFSPQSNTIYTYPLHNLPQAFHDEEDTYLQTCLPVANLDQLLFAYEQAPGLPLDVEATPWAEAGLGPIIQMPELKLRLPPCARESQTPVTISNIADLHTPGWVEYERARYAQSDFSDASSSCDDADESEPMDVDSDEYNSTTPPHDSVVAGTHSVQSVSQTTTKSSHDTSAGPSRLGTSSSHSQSHRRSSSELSDTGYASDMSSDWIPPREEPHKDTFKGGKRQPRRTRKTGQSRTSKSCSRAPARTACPHPGCAVTLARRTDLPRHLRTHSGLKVACPRCGKKFSSRNESVERHLRITCKVVKAEREAKALGDALGSCSLRH
ncbi:hypothetical protein CYLTODRAFT_442235 [Cylindrobasidium torrendii FP15055 ss-10]|uniref:C2H2-type domain-containing protein n=1 Tax=Cylindrobasidium torrendii FP15055 ss-10 TaxID=1314674 RepID=A0A0D7BJ53_9AGAR|nr:hypothetical protein CYLTODRAFT_442235 [Cylindrobasidium torrendii FP15055 ss-10]